MKYLYQNKYWQLNKEYNLDKILYLIIDRPNKIEHDEYIWINNNKLSHRNYDFPSWIVSFYDKTINLYWFKNDLLYREYDKPAYIGDDGYKQYYMNGNLIKSEWFEK